MKKKKDNKISIVPFLAVMIAAVVLIFAVNRAGQEEAHPYKKLSWKPMFEDETILNEDPSIPDADGKF